MAGRRRKKTEPLRFRGAPSGVEALAPIHVEGMATTTLALTLEDAVDARIAPLALQAEPFGAGSTRLSFALPESTPPGTYDGAVQIGDERIPVIVEVAPQRDLDASPASFTIAVAPGSDAQISLTLVNRGNVAVEIQRAYAFNLLERGGIEEAVHAALRESAESGEQRLARLMDFLSERHGGLVRVSVESGAGTLVPEESRELRTALRFGSELRPGAIYSSTWEIANLNLSIEVHVEETAPRRRRKEAA
jgi:hypothetical protein